MLEEKKGLYHDVGDPGERYVVPRSFLGTYTPIRNSASSVMRLVIDGRLLPKAHTAESISQQRMGP